MLVTNHYVMHMCQVGIVRFPAVKYINSVSSLWDPFFHHHADHFNINKIMDYIAVLEANRYKPNQDNEYCHMFAADLTFCTSL